MTWLLIIALTLASLAILTLVLRTPRGGWWAIGAALLLGLAGYAAQGRPDLPGAPRAADEALATDPAALVAIRQKLAGSDDQGDRWLMVADALARHGEFADAANILAGAVDKNPGNAQAWLALANALVGHSQGALSPAASFAFARAQAADPVAPGPRFFLGMVLARNGKLVAARAQWAALLAQAPANASWRGDLARQLLELDAAIARAQASGMPL